ncbi:ABC transporter ATP-binding protein [Pseudogracilibacillus sp. SO30301A]|uniref:ABC transporter ATP-binding protein n=1 Tax=Pseudogracilibacillus sp. SO30301A TaxID=3098291 RepID=UPI00300DE1EF
MLTIKNLSKQFDGVIAVENISISIKRGQTYGLVGESGSGKSTIGNITIGLLEPTSGTIKFKEKELWNKKGKFIRPPAGMMQIVFQDPQSSLDVRFTIKDIVTEPLRALPKQMQKEKFSNEYLVQLMRRVGMNEDHLNRYPHEFSGGQRQRIAIARAIITDPEFIILDEPTSALDVSVQAQILNLLKQLQKEMKLTYLFISHDMSVIRYMCDEIGVLYRGRLVEEGETEKLFLSPQEEYTKRLFSSLPRLSTVKEG